VACEILNANVAQNGFGVRLPFEHDLWVREEQDAGSWLHPTDWPGPIWLKVSGREDVIAQVVHPHAVSQGETLGDVPVANWLGLSGADLMVFFRPARAGAAGRRVCLFVWGIHSAVQESHDVEIAAQTRRAGEALARLHEQESARGMDFRGVILWSHLKGKVPDMTTHCVGNDVEVQGTCVPCDPAAWRREDGIFALKYLLYDCLTQVADGARP
jgi:hypothetical protein